MAQPQAKAQPRWKQYVARYYADALEKRGPEFCDPETADISAGTPEPYEIIRKIGRGKFGEVFEGIDVRNGQMLAIKVLKHVKKNKIKREVKILECVDGGPNIVRLMDIVRDPDSRMYSFVYEEVDNDDFKEFYPSLRLFEIKYYLYQMLKSLEFSHQMGIMHRDIKPHNVMIDHSKHKLRVIDWGLAEFYRPLTDYNVRVASRHYKGPDISNQIQYLSQYLLSSSVPRTCVILTSQSLSSFPLKNGVFLKSIDPRMHPNDHMSSEQSQLRMPTRSSGP
ncbi:MAG: putative Casein kinase II subunit alpha [Streblomastix strix]|uniref:non-specific serine/threonine protein kinase n=1 Tax=Streblomastix strix TaxID=222440 RepID=A0A5J4TX98_9EUKA|nr:MAG: putative Casein kinase II subunit alpha [Streblomastix strix]